VTLGTSVVTPTFRYHPAIVAQAMATLASLYPERVLLGVGTGESMNEVPVLGIEWPDFKERFGRLKEAIEIMRRLWTEERITFDGDFYHLRNATVYDRPPHPIPLYVAASGESAARLAGRVGDGLICTSGKGAALYRETLLPALAEAAAKAKRDPATLERMIEVKVSFDTDRDRALQDTRHWAALALPAEDKVGVEDPLEMERRSAALPIEKVASRWLVSSDPEEHVEQIAEYVGYGFTHLVFHAPGPDQMRFLEAYSTQILPRLRARFA
jgi:coenzyme F420-dependent glucose-6-phosphate dehydrogenase